jgi:chromosome segregation ATPase
MKEWFVNETEGSVRRVRGDIEKKVEGIRNSFTDLKEASKEFETKETIDAESRSAQNIYEKMTEMVEEFEFPEKITYKTAQEFNKDVEKFLQRVLTLGKRFIPNLGRKYKTRVFILNRALQRIQKYYEDFDKFLEEKTTVLQEVDNATDDIDLLMKKIQEREKLKETITEEKSEAKNIHSEISNIDENASDLQSESILGELNDIEEKITVLVKKLRLEVNSLDKPLRKLSSRAQDGVVRLPPNLVDLANKIRDKPQEAFLSLGKGHEKLNELLEILVDAMKEDKLKIKQSKIRKTIDLAEEILNGSIREIHNELIDLENRKKELEKQVEELGLEDKLQEIKNQQEQLEKNEDRKRRQIKDLERQLQDLNDNIAKLAAKTQKEIRRITDQDVKINITE